MTLDKIIHERSRLRILTCLAGSSSTEVSFTELLEKLEMSSGNLSIQLKKLNEASYVRIKKTFKDNKPLTTVMLTKKGHQSLQEYLDELEEMIRSLKK